MTIHQDILTFAGGRSAWQRDSLRRICTQPDLTEADIREILSNLKSTESLDAIKYQANLEELHLTGRTAAAHSATILTSVSDVEYANRLAPSQTLPFAENGITLIYGYNGSGKTGYARILKQVCRCRQEKLDPILGNVFTQTPPQPATATIAYKTGASPSTLSWKDGATSPSELSGISIFDAAAAPLYADQQNKIEFLPLGLDVLPRLAKLCDELSLRIAAEMTIVNARLATPLPNVKSVKYLEFLARFGVSTPTDQVPTEEELNSEFTWVAKDDTLLQSLEEEIGKISEPAKLAAQLTRLKRALETIKTKMNGPLVRFTAKAISENHRWLVDAKTTREAATLAAEGRFSSDPLGNSPTTPAWRKLFESAEAFNAVAYPGEEFPSTGAGRVCLLCQQLLSDAASERLNRFKQFLQDTTQKDAAQAEEKIRLLIRELTGLIIPSENEIDQQLAELIAVKPETSLFKDKLKEASRSIGNLRTAMVQYLRGEVALGILTPTDISVVADIDALVGTFDAETKTLEESAKDDSALTALRAQHAELLDKRGCSTNLAIFLVRRNDVNTLNALKKCKGHCDTTAISKKSSALRDTYLTADFRQKIRSEIEFLGLSYLPIVVEGHTDRGVGYIGVALSKTGREPTSRILSEGEFRGLALACFFAEIGSIDGHDGIVVDDPVSSLDHLHIEQVATRLVREAQVRPQVIVFTHDLAFYYSLWVSAAEAGVPVHRNWIQSTGPDVFGIVVSDDGPWQVKKVKDRLKILEDMIIALPDQAACTPDEYQKKTEGFYSKLRETWERLVEECLLQDVVGRFQPGVATQSLKGVNVTNADYKKVFFAMKKASEFSGHDRATARQPTKRSKQDMRNDMDELRVYEKELKRRSDEISRERRALETPPAAIISGR